MYLDIYVNECLHSVVVCDTFGFHYTHIDKDMDYYTLTAIEDGHRVALFGDHDLPVVQQELYDTKDSDYDKRYTSYKIKRSTKN